MNVLAWRFRPGQTPEMAVEYIQHLHHIVLGLSVVADQWPARIERNANDQHKPNI